MLTKVLWPGASTHLADSQGLAIPVLYWRSMGAHGVSATFTASAGYKPFLFLFRMRFTRCRTPSLNCQWPPGNSTWQRRNISCSGASGFFMPPHKNGWPDSVTSSRELLGAKQYRA